MVFTKATYDILLEHVNYGEWETIDFIVDDTDLSTMYDRGEPVDVVLNNLYIMDLGSRAELSELGEEVEESPVSARYMLDFTHLPWWLLDTDFFNIPALELMQSDAGDDDQLMYDSLELMISSGDPRVESIAGLINQFLDDNAQD